MRISDWSSDVCSSDLLSETEYRDMLELHLILLLAALATTPRGRAAPDPQDGDYPDRTAGLFIEMAARSGNGELVASITARSEEHTSELQSLMRISYAVFCLKKKHNNKHKHHTISTKNYDP